MRSPMIENADYMDESEKKRYSDLKVCRSAAGYYVGTDYVEDGFIEPGARDSGYFKTFEEAESLLLAVESGDEWAISLLRKHIHNY